MGEDPGRTLESRHVFDGRILKVHVDRLVEPSGHEVEREVVRHPGSVVLLALTPSERMLFVRQYRYPVDELLLEVPAGTLEPAELIEDAARRELVEETGYHARELEKLSEFYPAPGFTDERMHLFFAWDLEPGEPSPDDDEVLEVVELSVDEVLELQWGKEVKDAKTLVAIAELRANPDLLARLHS